MRACHFVVEQLPDRERYYNNLFFASYSMRENYLCYRDVIFVNRRLIKTRFSRSLLMFCAVNNNGKSVLCGFAMLAKEDEDGCTFAAT